MLLLVFLYVMISSRVQLLYLVSGNKLVCIVIICILSCVFIFHGVGELPDVISAIHI
jgi:hypothetical protein